MIVSERVPREKFKQFHAILCATGGRYTSEPFEMFGVVDVSYEPGDYVEQRRMFDRLCTPIRETRRDQWWRVLLCRLRGVFV